MTIPLAELVEQLDGYLESLNEHKPDRYACTAQAYINEWADPQHQFLRTVVSSANSIPVVELTADTEWVIGWLEDIQMQRAIGTESRFLLIMQMLRDIIQNSTDDPEERLKQSERQRANLDLQIHQLYETRTS